ncbi:hypothetical protein PITC_053590 [Penicillium italicum]|uniref:Uncharacterized protein n=1 Tax=Penicillium italicum TaxID=40296 RepID=A0A0A2KMJ0_PENIT|nr:hypothetical protein PITC_053590 [Penicillium italicum]
MNFHKSSQGFRLKCSFLCFWCPQTPQESPIPRKRTRHKEASPRIP